MFLILDFGHPSSAVACYGGWIRICFGFRYSDFGFIDIIIKPDRENLLGD